MKYVRFKTQRFFSFFSGNTLLHSPMALEKLGSWENWGPQNGPPFRDDYRGRKEAKEKTST